MGIVFVVLSSSLLITRMLPLGKHPRMFNGYTATGIFVRLAGLSLILPQILDINITLT